MTPKADALAALARIEEAQAVLRKRLRDVKPARLTTRPPNGEWSPLENVRHLLFAQQHHFGPHLPKGFRWSSVGVSPPNRSGDRRLSPVGGEPGTSIDEVFDAWAKINDVIRDLCHAPDDQLAWRLDGNLKHVKLHTDTIERLLRS